MPSVCAPFNRKTSSERIVCTHGRRRSGNLVRCIAITSSNVAPNIDGK